VNFRSSIAHSSTLASLGFLEVVDLAGFADGLVLAEAVGVSEVAAVVAVDDGVVLAETVASEGFLPSVALAEPHAAAVRSAAVTPAPTTYVLHLRRP
jgi:hypothetical protein